MVMPDRDRVTALVQRIVDGARISSRAGRDDLRRELIAHFEDAGASPEALDDALTRFGDEREIAGWLRAVYRLDYLLLYGVKIAASLAASAAAALVIELVVNLRFADAPHMFHLRPYFFRATGLAIAIVLALVTLWETIRAPIDAWRPAAVVVQPRRLLLVITAFAAVLYVDHLLLRVTFGALRALAAGAVLAAVCVSTTVILAHADRAFAGWFALSSDDSI